MKFTSKRWRCPVAAGWVFGLISVLAPHARAAFISPYALNNFTLTNMNADGTAVTPDGGLSIVLTGGNNGSGEPGTTNLTTTAQGSGLVQFNYSYSSLDLPKQDFAGYLLGNSFTQIADTNGQSGMISFSVTHGQTFGFGVDTVDNQFEPGILTVSNFNAPGGSTAIPEPGAGQMMFLGVAATVAAHRKLSRRTSGQEKQA